MSDTDEIIEQIFSKPHPKARKVFSHYQIEEPNNTHQIDILYLSHDDAGSSKRYKYKYALTLVDIASRYKAARALRNKEGGTVFDALMDIYDSDKNLEIPKVLNTDSGSEFKNKYFREWSEKNNVYLKHNLPGYHLSFVENMNMQLARKLYKIQSKKELETNKVNREWVENLPSIIEEMNNTKTRMIDMKPIEAIKLKRVKQPKGKYSKEDIKLFHNVGSIVRRLLNKDEILTLDNNKSVIGKRRATDPNFSLDKYRVIYVESHCEKCIKYHKIENIDTGERLEPMFTYYELLFVK